MGDLLVVAVEGDADDGGALGRSDGGLGLERRRDEPDGGAWVSRVGSG